MAEFRFQGVVPSGKVIQGTLTASNLTDAKKKLQDLSKGRPFRVQKIEKRSTFLYKVQKGDDKPIMGEQKAFSKDEVASGLTSMGYKVLYVRKKWFDFQGKPKTTDIVTFVRLSADLLREQLPYNEILQLLSNDIESAPLRSTIKDIAADLRQGKEAEKVFAKHEGTLGKFVAKMLGLASKSGNMIDLYDSTAKFIERQQEFRKSMKSAMIMPSITLILLFLATLFYVAYIFPETARMFSKYGIELPPMTAATLEFSDWLVDNVFVITFIHIAAFVGAFLYWKSDKGRFNIDKWVLKVPVLGSLIHKTIIEIFCRVFYSLYSGSGENIDVIRIACEATGNRYFEAQVKNIAIPMMLKHGKGLHESFEASGVFTKTALSRFHAGAETGTVRATALQLANYYERDTTYKLKAIVEYVQLFIALLIMVVMTAITIVSSETALIKPKQTPGFRGAELTLLLAFTSSITRKVRAWLSLLPRREKSSSIR